MSKLYTVEIAMTVVVCADNYLDAHDSTARDIQDIVRNIGVADIIVRGEIVNKYQLPDGWDCDTLPYGFDDDLTIGMILEGKEENHE